MGEKQIVFVVSFVALLTLNAYVDGSPACRQWLLTCCPKNGTYAAPGSVVEPVPYQSQNYYPVGAAPNIPTPLDSNDLLSDSPAQQPETIPANEPEETKDTTEPSESSEGAGPLPITGPRITRNTQAANTKSVSMGYPQPVGNSRAEGYTSYPGYGAYKVHKVGTAWYDALRVCASEGGTLAVISSTAEADLVKTMFRPNEQFPDAANNMHFWVGVQERGVDGQFYTVFGDHLAQSGYSDWSQYGGGQPNVKGNTDCVSIFIEGAYFDNDCTTKYAFVCKKIL